ncbi:hypothetical protein BC941DRAFT_440082 [Chlamydoabsidia padenii]|nr:hypothetical protein BC941DRAFT_440082 [Chlamydoabsidia padenii]
MHFSTSRLVFLLMALVLSVRADCQPSNCNCRELRNVIFCGDDQGNCQRNHAYICGKEATACDLGINESCQQCGKTGC